MKGDFLERDSGKNGKPRPAAGDPGKGGKGVIQAGDGEVEAQLLEKGRRADFLQEEDGGAHIDQQRADRLLSGLGHGPGEPEAAFLEAVDKGEVAEIPGGHGWGLLRCRKAAGGGQESRDKECPDHPSWKRDCSRSSNVGWE